MNAMTEALKTAGVPLPSIAQILWKAIKESQGITRVELSKRLSHINPNSVNSRLHDLQKRGMVYTKKINFRNTYTNAYYTDMGEFRMLPHVTTKPESGSEPKPEARPRPQTSTPAPTPPSRSFDLDTMTVGEARALYAQLKRMFG